MITHIIDQVKNDYCKYVESSHKINVYNELNIYRYSTYHVGIRNIYINLIGHYELLFYVSKINMKIRITTDITYAYLGMQILKEHGTYRKFY